MYNKLKNMLPHKIKVQNFSIRLLENSDIPLVQKFFENNSDFFLIVGEKPKFNEAERIFALLPKNKTLDSKFLIGLFEGEKLIAFVDMIQDYPENNQWSIGYYIIDIDYRNKGIGFELFKGIENILLSLGAKSVQIVIQEQNNRGLKFWEKVGFQKKSERKQEHFSDKNEFIMEKKIEKKEPTIEEKYFKNGKLCNFPSKPNEQQDVYKIMKNWFERGKKYSEIEVNNIIKSKIECRDHVTLRRDLVDSHYLNRSSDGKEYWIE